MKNGLLILIYIIFGMQMAAHAESTPEIDSNKYPYRADCETIMDDGPRTLFVVGGGYWNCKGALNVKSIETAQFGLGLFRGASKVTLACTSPDPAGKYFQAGIACSVLAGGARCHVALSTSFDKACILYTDAPQNENGIGAEVGVGTLTINANNGSGM